MNLILILAIEVGVKYCERNQTLINFEEKTK